MKRGSVRGVIALVALAASVFSHPAQAAEVGVSIGISQPGVHGRIDIGRFPQPQVVVQQPVIIARSAARAPDPVYLWVPPAHQKHWHRHCGAYKACGVPVYFVQERWYHDHVMRGERRGHRHGDRHDGRGGERGEGHRDGQHDGGHGRH